MGKDEDRSFLHIVSVAYFVIALIMLAIKFGIIVDSILANRIFEAFYYYALIPILVISLFLLIIFLIKSKRTRSGGDGNKFSKNTVSLVCIFAISFSIFASLWRTFSIDLISYNMYLLTLYFTMITVVFNFVIYLYFRNKVLNEYNLYSQGSIINKYILYTIIVLFILSIIIPNFTIHYGVISALEIIA